MLRRFVAVLLFCALAAQSSGVALASSPEARTAIGSSFRFAITPLVAAVTESRPWAMMTGQQVRWEALNARPPTPRHEKPRDARDPIDTSRERFAVRHPHLGAHAEAMEFPHAFDARHILRDKFAMRSASFSVGAPVRSTLIRGRAVGRQIVAARSLSTSAVKIASIGIGGTGFADSSDGLMKWWTYSERSIPGVGAASLNVGNGNLVVSAADFAVRERGINFDFTRVWNSMSQHDVNADDGAQPAIFGNQFTTQFDAHIVERAAVGSTPAVISVYDGEGGRWDYQADGSGNWIAPPGQHATLSPSDSTGCSYWWVQPNGASEWFYRSSGLQGTGNCGFTTGALGRLYQINNPNQDDGISLSYVYDGSGQTGTENIKQIIAKHTDGDKLTLNFELFGSWNELAYITLPDGATVVQYNYDANGNLVEVDRPGNGATNLPSEVNPVTSLSTPYAPETYSYTSGVLTVCGPLAVVSLKKHGACVKFEFNSSNQLMSWYEVGELNVQPNDGTSPASTLQPASIPTGWQPWDLTLFGGYGSSTVTMTDSNNHGTNWTVDGMGRVVATTRYRSCTTTCSAPIATTQTWGATPAPQATQAPGANEVIAETDARGEETDYAYDTRGNMIAAALPKVTVSVDGTNAAFRPTKLFSFDPTYNTTIATCDPYEVHALGLDWTSTPAPANQCPSKAGTTRIAHTNSADPYQVTSVTSPLGNVTTFTYNIYGMPLSATGPAISETIAGASTSVSGSISVTYNATGDVLTYSNDNTATKTWTYRYDALNRPSTAIDPTGVVAARNVYNADGSLQYSQTAVQNNQGQETAYTYDADGDKTSETTDYGGHAGTTQYWYDGLDRLVEAELPAGVNIDRGRNLWKRYLYDLTQAGEFGSLSYSTSPVTANGNMFKVQQCWDLNLQTPVTSCGDWKDMLGESYDGLDRPTSRLQHAPGTSDTAPGAIEQSTNAYDAAGEAGELSSVTAPDGNVTTLAYDAAGRVIGKTFTDATPSLSYVYDPDGRIESDKSSTYGTDSYLYDQDGHVTSHSEGVTGGVTAPATLTYGYYANGWRKSLTINAGSAFSNQQEFTYGYYPSGKREQLKVNGYTQPFSWVYDAAGRVTQQSDPYTGDKLPAEPTGDYKSGLTLVPQSMEYNPITGALNTMVFPNGASYSTITHDAEGDPTAYNISPPSGFVPPSSQSGANSPFPTSASLSYDVRGEFNGTTGTSTKAGSVALTSWQYFDGHPINPTEASQSTTYFPKLDTFTGASFDGGSQTQTAGCTYSGRLGYDVDGRNNANVVTPGTGCASSTATTYTRSYDSQNHVTQDNCAGYPGYGTYCGVSSYSYGWDGAGHLRIFSDSTGHKFTLHWDGDQLLFITNAGGTLVQLNVEKLATTYFGNGNGTNQMSPLNVYDRDFSGVAVDVHSASGDSGLTALPSHYSLTSAGKFGEIQTVDLQGAFPGDMSPTSVAAGPFVDMVRPDGYQAGGLTFQGVRAYDPNAMQWTTPDDFSGTLDDLMSQFAYAWNNGNPVSNQDPSGNDAGDWFNWDPSRPAWQNVLIIGGGGLNGSFMGALFGAMGATVGEAATAGATALCVGTCFEISVPAGEAFTGWFTKTMFSFGAGFGYWTMSKAIAGFLDEYFPRATTISMWNVDGTEVLSYFGATPASGMVFANVGSSAYDIAAPNGQTATVNPGQSYAVLPSGGLEMVLNPIFVENANYMTAWIDQNGVDTCVDCPLAQ